MHKENKNTRTPRLRFPEFREAGDWEENSLYELGETFSGLSGKSASDFGMGVPYVTYKQVFDRAWIDFDRCERVNISNDEKQNELKKGDILFTTSSETPNEVGFASVILNDPPKPLYLNSFCFAFRPFSLKKLNTQFSQYLFHSPFYRKSIGVLAQGSTRFNISKGAFLNLQIPIPKEEDEQQKIAALLTSLDDLITAQTEKIKALQAHKKGLMQQMFPAEGERAPRVRFREFREAGDWEESALGEVANFSSGGTPSKEVPEYWGGEIPWISATSMHSTTIEKSELNITDKAVKNGARLAKKGTLLILVRGSMLYNRIPMGIATVEVAFNQDVKALSLKEGITNYFLLYQLLAKEAQLLSAITATGIGAGKLDTNDLLLFPIHIPSEQEQQKIVNCLTSLDDLITAQREKLEALKLHKKGLMQGVFPDPNNETI